MSSAEGIEAKLPGQYQELNIKTISYSFMYFIFFWNAKYTKIFFWIKNIIYQGGGCLFIKFLFAVQIFWFHMV